VLPKLGLVTSVSGQNDPKFGKSNLVPQDAPVITRLTHLDHPVEAQLLEAGPFVSRVVPAAPAVTRIVPAAPAVTRIVPAAPAVTTVVQVLELLERFTKKCLFRLCPNPNNFFVVVNHFKKYH
jgi:hypothetical protein